jgi:mannose-6-phosphate isomerase-like protein (cupin superfamily)
MKHKKVKFKKEFVVLLGNSRSQCAEMVLAAGGIEGGPDNRHKGADPWLFVVSGKGEAIINGKKTALRKWTLVLIERGDFHEIRNSGKKALRTLNIYVPPAYSKNGSTLASGRS